MTVRSLRDYIVSHRSNVVFLSEIKCSKFDKIQKNFYALGFIGFEFVLAISSIGGLMLAWNKSVDLFVVLTNDHVINCMVLNDPEDCIWQFIAIYEPPTPYYKSKF